MVILQRILLSKLTQRASEPMYRLRASNCCGLSRSTWIQQSTCSPFGPISKPRSSWLAQGCQGVPCFLTHAKRQFLSIKRAQRNAVTYSSRSKLILQIELLPLSQTSITYLFPSVKRKDVIVRPSSLSLTSYVFILSSSPILPAVWQRASVLLTSNQSEFFAFRSTILQNQKAAIELL